MRKTHMPHTWQWCVRSGLGATHRLQYVALPGCHSKRAGATCSASRCLRAKSYHRWGTLPGSAAEARAKLHIAMHHNALNKIMKTTTSACFPAAGRILPRKTKLYAAHSYRSTPSAASFSRAPRSDEIPADVHENPATAGKIAWPTASPVRSPPGAPEQTPAAVASRVACSIHTGSPLSKAAWSALRADSHRTSPRARDSLALLMPLASASSHARWMRSTSPLRNASFSSAS
mmetsp:Transcript_86724/g.265423  ORF Transcript_86724/g.265423 Transcript_86724/m.265423 type:complete len:232 (-) Transcript_86724:233-928(-)